MNDWILTEVTPSNPKVNDKLMDGENRTLYLESSISENVQGGKVQY